MNNYYFLYSIPGQTFNIKKYTVIFICGLEFFFLLFQDKRKNKVCPVFNTYSIYQIEFNIKKNIITTCSNNRDYDTLVTFKKKLF